VTDKSFKGLIDAVKACSDELYRACEVDEWLTAQTLIGRRALLLEKISSIINSLNQDEINILGQLYQTTLANDDHPLAQAESELLQTREQLRHIKIAEKALPAYKVHIQ
jgi:hypothetical protein